MSHLLTAAVEDGKFIWEDRFAIKAAASEYEGKRVTVVIDEFTGWRSYLQVKYYRGYVLGELRRGYRDTLGIDLINDDAVHEIVVKAFIPTEDIINQRTGEIIDKKQRRTSDLNKREFCEFIERIQLFAAETLHIVIKDPDVNWRNNRLKQAA